MRRRTAASAAVLLSLAAIGISIAALFLIVRTGGSVSSSDTTGSSVLAVSYAVVGGLIVARRGHVIGWIMLLSGVFGSLNAVSAEYSEVALEEGWPLRAAAAWLAPWVWAVGAMAQPLVLLLFPTGRPPSPRWWWVGALTIGGALAAGLPNAVEAWPLSVRALTGNQVIDQIGDGAGGAVAEAGIGLLGVSFLLAAVSLAFRYRRATDVERQEIKWLLLGGAVTVIVMFTASPATPLELEDSFPFLSYVALLSLPAMPAAIGVAILRYRLYDIDVVINRTLVYGVLTAILALTYLGIVVSLHGVLSKITSESDLAVAASTLAVAALFRPLRARVQAFIDRRFYRRKYDARMTLESFSARLRDDVDLEHLAADLRGVVHETMQPAHVSVWLRPPQVPA